MVGVGKKIQARENVPQKIHAKDGPAFSHENRNATLPKFSARFDAFLLVGRGKLQLELEKKFRN